MRLLYPSEPMIQAAVAESQSLVIKAHQMQNRRMKVSYMNGFVLCS
jgi:hypothetical protein